MVTKQLQEHLTKVAKSQEECSKQLGNYELLLEDLNRRKELIQANFVTAAGELKSQHERHVG